MKRGRRRTILLCLAFVVVIVIIGIGVKKMAEPTEHEKQVAFLKKNEEEMTEFVKAQNLRVESVQFDWSSVSVVTIGNGLPQGGGERLEITGGFNELEDSTWTILIDMNNGQADMESMFLSQPLRIGGKIFE